MLTQNPIHDRGHALSSRGQINEIAEKWSGKSKMSKRFGVSLSKGTMQSFKYKALFELQFQVTRVT